MDEVELKQHTKLFALRVMKLVGALPQSTMGRVIGSQLWLVRNHKSKIQKGD